MLYNVHDMYIGRSLDLYGEFSEGEIDVFRQLVQPGNVVLEIGANIGAHTVFLAQHVGPTGRVLAFEPQRVVCQTLNANIALGSITNTYCFHQAVGSTPGEIVVPSIDYTQDFNFGGLSLGQYQQGERVPVNTIDNLGLPRCNFIKIDVEGMELPVLQGAMSTLTRFKPLLYVENDREDKSAALIRYLDNIGYAMYWHLPPLFNPNNFAQNSQNVFGNIISKNMICLSKTQPHQMNGFEQVEVPMEAKV